MAENQFNPVEINPIGSHTAWVRVLWNPRTNKSKLLFVLQVVFLKTK